MTWHKANLSLQVNYPPDIVKVKGSFRQTPLSITDKIQIHIPDTSPGTFILTTVQYLPNDGIFKPIPDIYCKYNMYRYYQIQPNIRFILIQPNI